ncbi:lipoyl(octanoyl) transferase LipB [uncultured Tessaracoccus sp.]|uniref:lipoyl(octanoyl) transferase LipB n=1 Tax=uncultured Tessaracoccus sp. TaxID=905023 RepID=UPI0025D1E992|nr:lipoyl(octanoyl) transferase LipB [uncultured Tessaracoccus sp.]
MLAFEEIRLGHGDADYVETWEYQRRLHDEVAAGERPGHVLFVEHAPVYTAGRRTTEEMKPKDGTPVVDVDRGGLITYHGPGQLVGYPIVHLPDGVGVVDHVRALERAVIDLLATYDIDAMRVRGRTGVWLAATDTRPERKICAIGVRVSRRTTLHGFALNVRPNAERFGNIIPCGITDAGVTSIHEEVPGDWTVAQVARDIRPHLTRALAFTE